MGEQKTLGPEQNEDTELKILMSWAKAPQLRIKQVREMATELSLDIDKAILGIGLDTILSDDQAAFPYHPLLQRAEAPKLMQYAQIAIGERVAWEMSLPQMPSPVHDALEQFHTFSQNTTVTDRTSYDRFRAKWQILRDIVDTTVKEDPKLQSARTYSRLSQESINRLVKVKGLATN